MKIGRPRKYQVEIVDLIRKIAKGKPIAEITEIVNAELGCELTVLQTKNLMIRNNIRTGFHSGRFVKGHVSLNKRSIMRALQIFPTRT